MSKTKKLSAVILSWIIMVAGTFPITAFAATESDIRNEIVSVASNEIGYTGSSSYSKYGEWYGWQGGWCTTFVLWCYNQAGKNLSVNLYGGNITPTGGNCNSMISWYQNKGRYHKRSDGYSPKSGDLVFFDWSGNGSSQHVGIVDYVSGSTVYTVEGNCSGKVKAREYTTSGSKPYNNVSAIMGYAQPDFSALSSGTPGNKTTSKKSTSEVTAKKNSSKKTTQNQKRTTTASSPTTSASSSKAKKVEKLTLSAANQDMMVGDTVNLSYSIEPSDTKAVVGYFCDEEGIIQIDNGGYITAIGSGNATVVVCVNDELYSQCNFNVIDAVAEVTTLSNNTTRKIVGTVENKNEDTKNIKSILTNIGVNVAALSQNRKQYIIPISIVSATIVICIIISISKKRK